MFRDSLNDGLDFLHDRFVDDELPRMSDDQYWEYDRQTRDILAGVLENDPDGMARFLNEAVLPDGDAGIDEIIVQGGEGDYVFRAMRPGYGYYDLARIPWGAGMTVEDAAIVSVMLKRAIKSLAANGLYA